MARGRMIGRRAKRTFRLLILMFAMSALCGGTAPAGAAPVGPDGASASGATRENEDGRRAAVGIYLRHIYAVYFGLRACSEMSTSEGDGSYKSEVSLDEARGTLKLIDMATAEIGVDPNAVWSAAAPLATVTAEALKIDPKKNVVRCHVMGALFRTDAANLQANLRALGAKTLLITKDY